MNNSNILCIFTSLLKFDDYDAFSTNAETKIKGGHRVESTSVISTHRADLGSGDPPLINNQNSF